MAPIVHGLEAKYHDQITFAFLDIDDSANNEFKATLGYFVQPDFFLLDGQGNVLQRWTGRVSAEELEAALQAALGS